MKYLITAFSSLSFMALLVWVFASRHSKAIEAQYKKEAAAKRAAEAKIEAIREKAKETRDLGRIPDNIISSGMSDEEFRFVFGRDRNRPDI